MGEDAGAVGGGSGVTDDRALWQMSLGYDKRFGALMIRMAHPDQAEPVSFLIRLSELLNRCGVQPYELRQYMADAVREPTPHREIDDIRREAIAKCDVVGKTVLDVGGYDGWAAKQALGQGAARAVCLDNQQYHHYGWADKQFEGVEYVTGDFAALENEGQPDSIFYNDPKRFDRDMYLPRPDVIIFYNVLYHTKNPWAALDKLREIIQPGGEMLLCTLFRYHDGAWMYVYEPRECNPTDDTVYFGPSLTALERLLRATGWVFERSGLAYDRVVYRCWPKPGWQRTHEDT